MANIKLGSKVAEGRTAEIYQWQPGWVLKLYRAGVAKEDVAREMRATRCAHASGFAAPQIGDYLEIKDGAGFVMQQIRGPDMLAAMLAKPWQVNHFARQLAELHLEMHRCLARDLPEQHVRLKRRLNSAPGLTEAQRAELLARLADLPPDSKLCHGDLHPMNVILSPDKLMVIDWVDATGGNPLADVARSAILLLMGSPPNFIARTLLAAFRHRFAKAYLARYFAGQHHKQEQYRRWLPIVAAARLNEGIEGENPKLLMAIQGWLSE